jgi:hypothetical protein
MYRASRFIHLRRGEKRELASSQPTAGYINEDGAGNLEILFPDSIPRHVCDPYSQDTMLAALDDGGALKKDGNNRKSKRVIPDHAGRVRCVVIIHDVLFPVEAAD